MNYFASFSLVTALLLSGCSSDTARPTDSGAGTDSGGGRLDAGGGTDSGGTDSGIDGGTIDGGTIDGGSVDGGSIDGGSVDGGSIDGGSIDGGAMDAGDVDAGASESGDCDTDADCPGGTCIELVPGGWRVCNVPPIPATTCMLPVIDECCDSSECGMGDSCILGPVVRFCGGPVVVPHNVCASDMCDTSSDCGGGGVCVPGGSLGLGVAACVTAQCRLDADCMDEANGRCVTVSDPCCGIQSLACVYRGDGCRTDMDCPMGFCAVDGTRSRCMRGAPSCPL